jgi:hypothetical protein
MSIKPAVDPRALSSTLGIAVRIAQRMGIHDENSNSKHPAMEAELRRRLWWSFVLYDARISEMTDFKVGQLVPTWDCKTPSNTNDFDFRTEMRVAPEVHGTISEALFAVVRSEFGDFTRRCAFHLDFINPALKSIVRSHSNSSLEDDDFAPFEQMIEQKYLQHCDPHNPLHYMTMWWARGQLAKIHFIKDLSVSASTIAQRTDVQHDESTSYALTMLECDTKLMSSKLITGFRWLIYLNFPFPAYVHIVSDLRRRPMSGLAQTCWNIMSENCTARFTDIDHIDTLTERKENPFFKIFAAVVLQAWAAREAATANDPSSAMKTPPLIVTQIKSRLAIAEGKAQDDSGSGQDAVVIGAIDPAMTADINTGLDFNLDGDLSGVDIEPFLMMFPQPSTGFDATGWGWPAANFGSMMG